MIGSIVNVQNNFDLLATYSKLLNSGSQLIVKTEVGEEEKLIKCLKMCGFISVTKNNSPGIVVGNKPAYNVNNNWHN